jgi:hypothetical protein
MCDHESKRGCAIGKGTREDRFVRKYIHKIDIKKRERDQEETSVANR